jgi:hypothetical protein
MQIKTILLTSCNIFFALPVNAAEKVNGVNKDIKVLSEVIPILTLSNPWLPSRGVRWT